MIKKHLLAMLVLIFLASQISALGITPGRTSLNFEPGMHQQISFSVLNTENKDLGVIFAARGDLAEYITFEQTSADFSAGEESKSFVYNLNLPQKFEKPGRYEAEIIVLEVAKGAKDVGASVGGTIAVISQLHVYVPYPNKYVEAEANVIENDGKLTFIVPVYNRGKLDVVSIKANIDIFDSDETKIVSLETDEQSMKSFERKELSAEWKPGVNPGRYKAVITVRYDNEVTTVLKEFNVGEKFLDILEVNVLDFELGGIAKFNALVENKWSSQLHEVYLNILVYNNEGEVMADFKSPTYDIDPLSKTEMVCYWDTAGVQKGTYSGKLVLRYGEKSTERSVEMKISDYSIEVVGLTGRVIVEGKEGGFNLTTILILVIGILVVANVIWFVLIKRFMDKFRGKTKK